jgi:hypothetical protein
MVFILGGSKKNVSSHGQLKHGHGKKFVILKLAEFARKIETM